jgi:hypothetical protein
MEDDTILGSRPRPVVELCCPACDYTCPGEDGDTCPNDGATLVPVTDN